MSEKLEKLLDELVEESKKKFESEKDKEVLAVLMEIISFVKKEIIKTRVLLQKRKITWEELEEKPELVMREEMEEKMKGMSKKHQKEMMEEMKKIENICQKIKEEMMEKIPKKELVSHKDLLEVLPDQHHKEYHTLESHDESVWRKKFERLISGQVVDDLHKHTYELPPVAGQGPYIDISGAYQPKTTDVSADYTVRETDDVLLVDATSGNIEIKLEQAIYRKSILIIKNVSTSGSNTITITPNGSEQIDNAANYTMDDLNESVILVSDSSNWWTQRGETTTAIVSDTAYAASWDGVTDVAPSKNAVYDKIETLGGGHDAVTLDANADTLLSLSTQALGLDTQTANLIFAGPTTGAAAVPAFRSLVAGDIPDISATYQPLDADLTAIAALGFASTSFLKKTGADTWALDTNTYLTSVTAHDILSATHGDTTAAAVVRGDIIIGSGVTPKWTRLAVGASTTFLKGGTEPAWATLNQAAVAGLTTADSPTFTGILLSGLSASEIVITDASKNLISAAVATYPSLAELAYVKGVTSALQGQIDGKAATNQTMYIGTTAVAINRASAALTLAGITLTTPDIGTPSAGVLTNCTGLPAAAIVAGTLAAGTYLLAENASIGLDPAGSADGKYTGITVTGTGGAVIAFGDLVTLDKDDSRWELVDISVAAAATGDARGIIGIAVTSSTDGGAITVLLNGIIRADANFPALTIGAAVYASTTGDIVVAQPTTTDHVIRVVGYALTADEIYFNPENDWISHT